MGAGEATLTAAAGWFVLFIVTAIVGGVMAIGLLLLRGGVGGAVRNVLGILSSLIRFQAPYRGRPELDVSHSSADTLPHAVSIAIGSLLFRGVTTVCVLADRRYQRF